MELKNKNIFLEALLLTIMVFLIGILIGVLFEQGRVNKINEYYAQSEVSLIDILTLNNLANLNNSNCNNLINSNINFANKIYDEAKILEKYEEAGKISDNIKLEHKKYDVMRTLLWINIIKVNEVCKNNKTKVVVYLYKSNDPDLTKKATNNVWSKILLDLKNKYGNEIILIPIAVDNNLVSLNSIINNYEISDYPVVIINNKDVLKELSSVEDIEKHFK